MGLNNTQYDTIMRQYSLAQSEDLHQLEERRRAAYEKIPKLAEIDRQVAAASLSCARMILDNDADNTLGLKETLKEFSLLRSSLLKENGFPSDYLELHYFCPDCQDTGYRDGRKCHCFRQAAIDLFYTQSGIRDILKIENFDHFTYRYYPADLLDPTTGISSLDTMKNTVDACHRFLQTFDQEFSNLFFYGGTGLGKTFLSHCIARELIESAHSVIYYSSFELFDLFARSSFGKSADSGQKEYVFDCDLLIIDDMGTELTNSFISSQLFLILNERIQRRKSTVISTNLPLATFAEVYSERVFSRITSHFQLFHLFGNDIRLQKKLGG
ncbi:MAG: ATP-binding protein [Lachnospiraceae bacterium]|nr:ATP-binding protein [Lachnospiraceae bacterium]